MSGLAAILEQTRGAALELARSNTKLNEETYAAGTTPFLTILESQRQRLMVEQMAVETEEKLAAAITDWQTRACAFPDAVGLALRLDGGSSTHGQK